MGDLQKIRRSAQIRQQDDKFIAANPRHGIACPGFRSQNLCHLPQQPVPDGMAIGIIHRLEMVEIKMHQAEILPVLQGPFQFCSQRPAVSQPGQRIGQRLFLRHRLGTLQPQIQVFQLLHDSGFRLHHIEQFHGKIGRGEIRICQGVILDSLDQPDAE